MKKIKLSNFLNENSNNKTWFGKNYFFVSTLIIIVTCMLLFAFGKSDWMTNIKIDNGSHWTSVLYFNPVIHAFLNSFAHLNWQHTLLNMLCFLVVGLYLERKTGTIKLFLIVTALAFFTSTAVSTNNLSVGWRGFSCVNFGLYAYIIINYLFSFQKSRKNKFNTIFGAVVITLIYFAMCFSGGTSSFSFAWYPYDLLNNMGHYCGFLTGLVFGLTVHVSNFQNKRNLTEG